MAKGRESDYWTVQGSRSRGSLQDCINWTDPALTAPTSPSYFPFILDHPAQQHQDPGEYQHQEARDWTAFQQAARENERGMQREGWPRRWEPCSPVHYNREMPKRNESSFRELEAWALRYSHSLPRRRRIEAELRGNLQGLSDSVVERSGSQGTSLQQVTPPTSIRESGLWDRASRQQAANYYFPQAPATGHTSDIKEKINYQTKTYSHPPNYMAPPPYNSPHKNVPTLHQWESKKQSSKSQSVLKKQDLHRELYDKTMEEKGGLAKPEVKTKEPESSPIDNTNKQPKLPLPQPPLIQINLDNEVTTSKIIEGRKFKINKKAGGMTIFCLVSRIADTATVSPETNVQSEVVNTVTNSQTSQNISQLLTLADEVDFKTPVQTSTKPIASRSPYFKLKVIPICKGLTESLSNTADKDISTPKRNKAETTFGKQYPLWREPSFTSCTKADNSSTACYKDTDNLQDTETSVNSSCQLRNIDGESQDMSTELKDSNDLLMIDTTCVVVKVEVLQTPKKEQVHYLSSGEQSASDKAPHVTCETVQLNENISLTQHNAPSLQSNPVEVKECEDNEKDLNFVEKKTYATKNETASQLIPENLEERAKRIIGLPLHDCTTTQVPEEESVENEMKNDDINEHCQDKADNKQPQNDSAPDKTEEELYPVPNAAKDQVIDSCTEVFSDAFTENIAETPPETDTQTQIGEIPEDSLHKSDADKVLRGGTNQPVETDHSSVLTSDMCHTSSISKEESDTTLSITPSENLSPAQLHTQEHPDPDQAASNLSPAEVDEHLLSNNSQKNTPQPPTSIDPTEDQDRDTQTNMIHLKSGLTDNVSCDKEDMVNDEKDNGVIASHLEKTHEELTVKATHVDGLQQQKECGQIEDVPCLKETLNPEEQLEELDILGITPELAKEFTPEETQTHSELQKQLEYVAGEEAITESRINKEGLFAKDATENTESDIETETSISTNTQPLVDDVLQSQVDKEIIETVSLSSSNLDCSAAAILETVHSFINLDTSEQTISSITSSPSSDTCENTNQEPLHSAEHEEKAQYPKSLWDVVNRIRKHTAPDSENEEDEVTDMWDPESVVDNAICSEDDTNVFDEAVPQVYTAVEGLKEEQIQSDPCHDDEPLIGHTRDDTLSCSSNSSHKSEETLIEEDEYEAAEKTNVDSEAESHEDQCCAEEKDQAASGSGDTKNKDQIEEFLNDKLELKSNIS